MTPWYEGPLAALTLKAGPPAPGPDGPAAVAGPGADPERDRIAAAAVAVQQSPHAPVETHARPRTPDLAAGAPAYGVARALASHAAGRPLVVLNAPYDLTLLDRELRRDRHGPLPACLGVRTMCVIDPVLLDARLNRTAGTRRPRRDLAQLCGHYGVSAPSGTVQEEAAAALELARALGRHFAPRLAGLTPAALHTLQAIWFAAGTDGPVAWFTGGTRRPADHIWPLRPVSAA